MDQPGVSMILSRTMKRREKDHHLLMKIRRSGDENDNAILILGDIKWNQINGLI